MACLKLPVPPLPPLPLPFNVAPPPLPPIPSIDLQFCCKLPLPFPPLPPIPFPPIVINPGVILLINAAMLVIETYLDALEVRCPRE